MIKKIFVFLALKLAEISIILLVMGGLVGSILLVLFGIRYLLSFVIANVQVVDIWAIIMVTIMIVFMLYGIVLVIKSNWRNANNIVNYHTSTKTNLWKSFWRHFLK